MVKKLFSFFACFRLASQPHAFGNRAINQFLFRSRFENFIERISAVLLVNLSSATDRVPTGGVQSAARADAS
jgi:hypothetical protein